jgi:hypothetical protein
LSQRPEVKALGNRRSFHAARGTVAHRVAEQTLGGEDPTKGVATEAGYDIDVDDALVDAVNVYTELVEAFIATAEWHVVEQRVSLDPYWIPDKPPVPVFGTTDFAGYQATTRLLRVIDYKHGSGVYVRVKDNPQALAYAAGALLLCPGPVSEVEVTIVQPNVAGPEKIRTDRMSVVDLLLWVHETLIPGIRRTQTEPFTYVQGQQCRWCPGAALCPLLAQDAMEDAMRDFHEISLGSPEDLSQALDQAERAELWIKAVRELATKRIEGGDPVPGWGLFPTRPVRSWDNPDQVELKLAPYEAEGVFEFSIRSPTQLEKLFKGRPEVWELLAPHVQLVSKGTKLAREGG